MKKGFITIATGKEIYYKLAEYLLKSYKLHCDNPLPFALLCDRENEYTKDFDDVIIFKEEATNSYLDKLSLGEYLPYDENIFIDADCLAFGDINILFEYFQNADDFSCFGRVLPLDDKTGWFEYENLGELQTKVSYVVGLHGGIYYMRNTPLTRQVFDTAKSFIPEYSRYKFKGKFEAGDEPVIALSMAVNNCHPEAFRKEGIYCYWENVHGMKIDITEGMALVENEGINTRLLHWGTRYTYEYEYIKQCELIDIMLANAPDKELRIKACIKKYNRLITQKKRKQYVSRVINKIKRTLKLK